MAGQVSFWPGASSIGAGVVASISAGAGVGVGAGASAEPARCGRCVKVCGAIPGLHNTWEPPARRGLAPAVQAK